MKTLIAVGLSLTLGPAWAQSERQDTRPTVADIRGAEVPLKLQDGDFVAVPIPISNPTLGTGLVLAAAYFYPQTEEEAAVEPASVTGIGGLYTSNKSKVLGIGHQAYWGRNRWRMTGAAGAAEIRVNLVQPAESGSGTEFVDWVISGGFLDARLSRRFAGHWYGGGFLRAIGAQQRIASGGAPGDGEDSDFVLDDATIIGLGMQLEFDNRDMPIATFSGRHLEVKALFNDAAIGSDETYQSYTARFRSYHTLAEDLVLAWEANACLKSGSIPLWDACKIPLRGFSAFNYLGEISLQGQAEIRWQASRRWGFVGFAGLGEVSDSYEGLKNNESIPSYGLGVRFAVLPDKRVNLRVDFARSTDDDAIHVSVGEAF